MSFVEAIKSVLSKYVTFSGRARRSEFWWWYLAMIILSVILYVITGKGESDMGNLVSTIVALAVFLPNLAVAIRRLHDIGKCGWWVLINLVPLVGWIILLIFYVRDSEPGTNQYGPNPKDVVEA